MSTPSLHLHYKDFITTTSFSALVPNTGIFALGFLFLVAFPFCLGDKFQRSILKAYVRFMSPMYRTPSSLYFRLLLNLSRTNALSSVLMPFLAFDTLYGAYVVVHLPNIHLMPFNCTFSSNVHHK